MTLRVLNMQAENYKRIKAIDITPDGNVVFIGGRNAQGKTSVLDAIWAGVAGGDASRATQQPIREGEERASVRLDLGDYIVTRRWSKNDAGTLTVESREGAKFSSPQALLDNVVGARAFDPLAFTRQTAKQQVETLLGTVELTIDPEKLAAERKLVYGDRTAIGRDVTRLEGQLASMPEDDASIPDEEISTTQLLADHSDAVHHNRQLERHADVAAELERSIVSFDSQIEDFERRIAEVRERRADAEKRRDATTDAAAADRIDVDEIAERIAAAENTNRAVRAVQTRRHASAELDTYRADVSAHTARIEAIDQQKADALAAVSFPVEGLSFDDTGVLFNGIPFSQASAAEQLRVSVALAMAANPTLRVLRILDGSLLDSDSLEIIATLAAENDYQVWIEVVDETGSVGFVIEDGLVKQ